MKAPCGQEDCDCGHTIAKLQEEVDSLRTALNQDGHVLEFRKSGWAIEHPVECRSGSLLDCRFNFLCEEMGGPPEEGLGRYKAAIGADGTLILAAIKEAKP
ncbi:hypothetical protein LCGC14_1134560 [marine sediment metagenome]|uniref:Uncharacterized protein n=1 Tax=marine sediment metagenome TaxID=412755 RepID=A0A0F9M537_9ZZZZ